MQFSLPNVQDKPRPLALGGCWIQRILTIRERSDSLTSETSATINPSPVFRIEDCCELRLRSNLSGVKFHIDPVAGSTTSIPIKPPKTIFPQYQPESSERIST